MTASGELLSQARVLDISRNVDDFIFTIGSTSDDDAHTFFEYIHHEIGCGECGTQLGDDFDAVVSGEISEEEYDRRFDEAIDKCWRDGLTEMGYELREVLSQ